MKIEVDASGSDEYGDYATVRLYFEEQAWIEIAASHAQDINHSRPAPYGQGAKVTIHNADGTEETAWDGFVMPKWYADRLAKQSG